MNSFQKARPTTTSIIWALWDVCVKQFAKKDRIYGQTTRGFCTTITHRTHNAIVIREHLAKNETNTVQQPPNLPDLASCDFFVFGRLKKPLRGTRYSTRDEVMEKSKMALMAIPQTDYKNVSRIGSRAAISVLQSMGSTLQGTISIMMIKLVFWILKIKF